MLILKNNSKLPASTVLHFNDPSCEKRPLLIWPTLEDLPLDLCTLAPTLAWAPAAFKT